MIVVYNRTKEDYSFMPNNYYIGRGGILGNPYSHLPSDKCQAIYKCRTREESIERYSTYFDLMYGRDKEFTKVVDEIYEKYKNGEDIYLECYCKPEPCHGDIIVKKLQQRLLREKFEEIKKERNNGRAKEVEKVL
jgi:hypothetical protein